MQAATEPAEALALAMPLLAQRATGWLLPIPGKAISGTLAALRTARLPVAAADVAAEYQQQARSWCCFVALPS